ncbi:MAG: PsbP-related protein [Dehalococcoidia bacterium]
MFDATYTNDEYGFSFMYPGNWIPVEKSGAMVFAIAASSFQGADGVNASVAPASVSSTPEADFGKAIKAAYDEAPGLKNIGVTVNVESSKLTTLADGKTFAAEAIVTAKIMIVNMWGYSLGINKDGVGIVISGFTLGDQAKKDQIMAICKTLALK